MLTPARAPVTPVVLGLPAVENTPPAPAPADMNGKMEVARLVALHLTNILVLGQVMPEDQEVLVTGVILLAIALLVMNGAVESVSRLIIILHVVMIH